MKTTVLSVTQLNSYVKSVIDGDLMLQSIFVVGEISNFTNHYRTGHYYLTLKDENCAIKAVMFRSANQRLRFVPENGMNVIVRGRVSLFERDGQYQFYIEDMQPDGIGALNLAFEQLKNKLAAEGLFDVEFKKPIPKRNYRIGVVTSATGAVIQDIKNVVERRFPLANIILAPVQVQGSSAAPQIAQAIDDFNSYNCADVLIVGRGGGSLEDLWAFNEEIVARAVFRSQIPVISAVGHETDFTICDFVADLRAPTPSAAAELAVPNISEDKAFLDTVVYTLESFILSKIEDEKQELELIKEKIKLKSPESIIDNRLQSIDTMYASSLNSIIRILDAKQSDLSTLAGKLDALSPLKVMARGFSLVSKNDKIITNSASLNKGDVISLEFVDGKKNCEVL